MKLLRFLCPLLLGVVLGALVFAPGGLSPVQLSLAAEDPGLGTEEAPYNLYHLETVRAEWNNSNPGVVLAGVELQIMQGEAVVSQWRVDQAFPSDAEKHTVPLYENVKDLANGVYYLQVRVYNEAEDLSGWCTPCYFVKAWADLQPPGGCAILRF